MAQRAEKEETEFKVVPETITPCVNNCGVTGNPATNNMCQKCFNASTGSPSSSSSSSSSPALLLTAPHKFSPGVLDTTPRSTASTSPQRIFVPAEAGRDRTDVADGSQITVAKREVNRCSGCRRKVGLTGFRCRCGDLFCGEHRYSDRHDCSYDYRAAGRDAIARENPVVKAAKIVRL